MLSEGTADISGYMSKFTTKNGNLSRFAAWVTDETLDFVFSRHLARVELRQLIDMMLPLRVLMTMLAVSTLLFAVFYLTQSRREGIRTCLQVISIWLDQPILIRSRNLILLTSLSARLFSVCFHARLKSRMFLLEEPPFRDVLRVRVNDQDPRADLAHLRPRPEHLPKDS